MTRIKDRPEFEKWYRQLDIGSQAIALHALILFNGLKLDESLDSTSSSPMIYRVVFPEVEQYVNRFSIEVPKGLIKYGQDLIIEVRQPEDLANGPK